MKKQHKLTTILYKQKTADPYGPAVFNICKMYINKARTPRISL
ncbi:hypothetical protein LX64_04767 [Chitinophaga skermanii]|uniref:Uncharacterized protein n=1 Tax=Chitinophaga skermanii TaxID=331697 RepID=A0A327Q1R4_9BACT|nr:hypothetical protein LX64_04767 [Chitinophaga skermanii]